MRRAVDMPYGMPPAKVVQAPNPAGELTLAAAALTFAAGVVHLALIVPHLSQSVVLAVLFSLAGVAEIGFSVAIVRARTPELALVGQALLLSVVIGWLMSRTTGLPLAGDASRPEAFGLLDCLTSGCELFAVYVLSRLRAPGRGSGATCAGITLAVLLLLTLATLGHHALS